MYACGTCSRTFATQGTLYRHEQNHSQSRKYTCSECQVSFRRRDLLSRHLRIHGTESSIESAGPRQRSRTACKHCRLARVKCTGQLPCGRCKQRDLQCHFTDDGFRTSVDRRVTVSGLPSPSSAAGLDHISGDADQDIDFTDTSPQIYDQSIVPFQTDSESTALLNSSTADLPPDVLAWPWLHENLFLQGDMNLDWYEISARTEQAEAVDIAGTYSSVPAVPQDGLDTEQLHHVNGGRLPSSHVSGDVGCDDTNRAKYVEEVVKIASQISQEGAFQGQPSQQRILFLRDVARLYGQLEKLFDLPATDGCQDIESRTVCSFQSFLLLYKNHFWPLWPFTPRRKSIRCCDGWP